MKKIFQSIFALMLGMSFAQCSDYLDVSSPSNTDDAFVTSSPTEVMQLPVVTIIMVTLVVRMWNIILNPIRLTILLPCCYRKAK